MIVPGGVDRAGWGGDRSFRYLVSLVERLARSHDVQIFALDSEPAPSRYDVAGATVHNAAAGTSRRRAYFRTLAGVIAEHRREPFDVIHAFWLVPPGLIGAMARRFINRPILVHVAGGELVSRPNIGYGWRASARGRMWVRLALRGSSRVSAASEPLIRHIAAAGYAAERIPFGVDLARWAPVEPRPRPEGRAARLVHVGNLNLVKDQDTLIRAAVALRSRGVDFQLDVAGLDTRSGSVQRLAGSLGIADRVRFHGYLGADQVRSLMTQADVLWHSSLHEAGPFVFLEAAVCGLPTVGTAVGHIAERAPGSAVAVPVGDADGLAREAAALLADDRRRLALARAAQRQAIAEDADWTARRVEGVYRDMISGARPRDPGR